jgi:hypothetical protein
MDMATAKTVREWPRWRRLGASGSLAALPGWVAALTLPHSARDTLLWFVLGGLTAAAVGLSRVSVIVQVCSRAVAWLIFAPSVIATLVMLLFGGRSDLSLPGMALASGAALLLSRPALGTKEARAEFAPVAYRRWFLASSIVSVAAAALVALVAVGSASWDHQWAASTFGLLALSSSLLASAVGVLRMRGWGVLLGGATAVAALVTAVAMRGAEGAWLASFALPGVMFGLPVLASKRRPVPSSSASGVESTSTMRVETPSNQTRLRVSADEGRGPDYAELEDPGAEAARRSVAL